MGIYYESAVGFGIVIDAYTAQLIEDHIIEKFGEEVFEDTFYNYLHSMNFYMEEPPYFLGEIFISDIWAAPIDDAIFKNPDRISQFNCFLDKWDLWNIVDSSVEKPQYYSLLCVY